MYQMCNAVPYKENSVETVFANVYVKFKKTSWSWISKHLSDNLQLVIHTSATVAPHWWLHRDEGNDLHIENTDWHPLVRLHWMGQWVEWALLYWSEDDKLLMASTDWDFLHARQSARTTRFYNTWSKNSYTDVSPRLQTNQIKQVCWSFIIQLLQAWWKIKDETPPPLILSFFCSITSPRPQLEATPRHWFRWLGRRNRRPPYCLLRYSTAVPNAILFFWCIRKTFISYVYAYTKRQYSIANSISIGSVPVIDFWSINKYFYCIKWF
jgi:hypothetical protein